MRAAVYNRYWPTGGGGEAYGAGLAYVLRQRADVDLLCHEPVDLGWLSERLRVPLEGVRARVVTDRPGAVTTAARDYDLFVNVSFMSGDAAPSHRSLYVVHFPTPPELGLSKGKKAVIRGLRAVSGPSATLEPVEGFYDRDPGRRGVRWTTGEGVVRITLPEGAGPTPVTLVFGSGRPEATIVTVEVDGEVLGQAQVGGPTGRQRALRGSPLTVVLDGAASREHVLRVCSSTFVPAEGGGSDTRALGVPVRALRVGRGLRPRLEAAAPWLATTGTAPDWQSTYGALIANSRFTQTWIRTWWSADSQVLYPPVSMQTRGEKEQIILNVGRFFPAHEGHSKKQLELVRAFRRLVDGGLEGWTLRLVGGCEASGRPYLEQVRAAAAGYPVEITVDASGEELTELYASASIYWHASGMGENAKRHPGRLEHFGMTTVEAMSAGAVPVVIGLAGQTETVRHGVDGFHFHDLGGLVALTRLVIDDADLRNALSVSAMARARAFSIEAFAARFWNLADALHDEGDPEDYGVVAP